MTVTADDMILCIEDPKDTTRKLLELINEFGKFARYKIDTPISLAFLYTRTKDQKDKLIKQSRLPSHQQE